MKIINKGENVIIRRNLKKADGTDLLLSSISSLSVSILQNGVEIVNYTYPSTYLRQGTTTSQLEIEISTTNSNKFNKGLVTAKYTITASSASFTGEGIQKDIIEQNILTVR